MPILFYLLALIICTASSHAQEKAATSTPASASTNTAPARYEQRHRMVPGGTGRYYMEREIAHVVSGNETLKWLERPEREQEEDTSNMVKLLELKPGEKAADIGAGTGYITRRMAEAVGPKGTVYAVEINEEMIELLQADMRKRGQTNVVSVRGTETDAKLPANTLDLIVMVDVYHEFTHPYEMMENMVKALKPGGRLVFVEFKAEDKKVPIYPAHKMSEAQVKKEALIFPDLEWSKTHPTLPWQHVIIFKKKAPSAVK
ncbi:MAG: class I SAM-dependent methyltransferase [Verrucomicrobiota bacterium]